MKRKLSKLVPKRSKTGKLTGRLRERSQSLKVPTAAEVSDKIHDLPAVAKIKHLGGQTPVEPAPAGRITNDTVAAHREEVLSSARKYIYPLQHSKHRIVTITTTIVIVAFVAFMSYSVAALYRFGSTSSFLYRVTQVIPFPVAKAGPRYVSYENYLFEMRHYIYFYQNQLKLDINSAAGKQQINGYKKQALQKVINQAYIKELADEHKISVSNREVDNQIAILRQQNRLGGSQQAYEDALRQNFGWSPDDFKRVVKQQLLEQKVVSTLDTATHQRAKAALAELNGGADFAAVAAKYSDDTGSRGSGGAFPAPVALSDRDVSPVTTAALFKLKPGQTSGIVNIGYSLQILKNLQVGSDGKVKGAHIDFNFKPITSYIDQLKAKQPARRYISP